MLFYAALWHFGRPPLPSRLHLAINYLSNATNFHLRECVCTQTEKQHPQFLLVAFFPDVIISSSLPTKADMYTYYFTLHIEMLAKKEIMSSVPPLFITTTSGPWSFRMLKKFLNRDFKTTFWCSLFWQLNWNKISHSFSERENWMIGQSQDSYKELEWPKIIGTCCT